MALIALNKKRIFSELGYQLGQGAALADTFTLSDTQSQICTQLEYA